MALARPMRWEGDLRRDRCSCAAHLIFRARRVDLATAVASAAVPRYVRSMDKELSHKVCRLIAGLVVSDDDLDSSEDAFIDRMLLKFGIPQDERDTIFPIVDKTEAKSAMQDLPADVQQEAVKLLLEAAVADGKVVTEERAYLHAVAEAIGISAGAMNQKIDDALAKRG